MKKLVVSLTIMLAFALGGVAQQTQRETKDESCPRPENLEGQFYYHGITDYGAYIYWGTMPSPPIEDWLYYDNGVYATSIGSNDTILYWGSMFPASMLTPYVGTSLTKVALCTSHVGLSTVNVYLGGITAPDSLVSTQSFNMVGDTSFMEILLNNVVPIDGTQNLWITFYNAGVRYPADACYDSDNANNRWVSVNGNEWMDLATSVPDYGWMIRGFVTNQGKEMELLAPAEGRTDDWQLQYYKIYKSLTHTNSNYDFLDSVPFVEGQLFYEYYDNLIGTEITHSFSEFYRITAVYSDTDGNWCESEPGISYSGLDYLYVGFSGTSPLYDIVSSTIPEGSKWYYEIGNESGSVTYQDLQYAADTAINGKEVVIIIRTNTLYDKDWHTEVTREYIYKEDFRIYWWNKDLNEFTLLLNPCANVGDEWDIKVGTETITVHVDAKDRVKHDGIWFDRLYLSDEEGYFSGPALFNIGNMTSFFPEKLISKSNSYDVNGLRCYWVNGNPLYTDDETDCDAVWGIEEPVMTSHDQFAIYPNPTDGILIVETVCTPSLPNETYRITNLMGQTLMTGQITDENQQIDVSDLPDGMYFITFAGATRKFVVR
jgi:hypothetical protein